VDVPLDCHLMIEILMNLFLRSPLPARTGLRSPGSLYPLEPLPGTDSQPGHEARSGDQSGHSRPDLAKCSILWTTYSYVGQSRFRGQKFIYGALEKVRKLATMRNAKGLDFRIEIDGGIDLERLARRHARSRAFCCRQPRVREGDPARNVEALLKRQKPCCSAPDWRALIN